MGRLFFFYSFLCFVLLTSRCFSSSFEHHVYPPTEASALLLFKKHFEIISDASYSCDRVSFPKTKSWNESRDCCSWDGVTCDLLNGHVIGLDLSCSLLFGTFHPNSSLFQLHHLHTLNLAYNDFYPSSIPHNIGRLTNLRHLNLSWSSFYGKIPTEISYLSNLVSLDLANGYELQLDERTFETMLHNFTNLELLSLSFVNISSPIPVNISSSLRYVDLDDTNLRGILTESFFLLPNRLETLKLSGNDLLKGVFPKIHPSNTLLMELDISYTGISGELPHSIGTFSSLNILNLEQCQFSGPIPDSIGNLTQITELILSYNHFIGHIPSTISKLKHLTNLHLSSNSFSGEIPYVFSNLQELCFLDLFNNSFIGSFPSSISNLTHLQQLDLSSNSLSGTLPNNASTLQNLTQLYLSNNLLNGTIPSWVFSLPLLSSLSLQYNQFSGLADEVIKTNPTLKYLDLSHNQLSGSFPQSLVNLTNLSTLDLSSNNITIDEGMNITFPSLLSLFLSSCELKDFPHFMRNLKTLHVFDFSNNKICGQIPNWFSDMRWDSLWFLNLSHNSLTGHLPQFHYYSLEYLDLKFNSLQGPLPSSICNMSSLIILDLSHNYFSDSVPHCLGSMALLTVLDLRRNNFTGSLPPLCEHSTSLNTIVVNGNQFEGPVPVSLCKCNGLQVLDVGNNAINDTFPAWLGTLQLLQVLILTSNKFHGPISTCQTKFCFPKLRIFDLSRNDFSGSLPAKVFGNFKAMIKLDGEDTGNIKYMESVWDSPFDTSYEDSVSLVIKGLDIELERISTIRTTIDLSSNNFEGVISKTLKDLSSLWLLNLSHNNLKGDIPMELGKLNMLEALDLSWNRLTGSLPQLHYYSLKYLDLKFNSLQGPLPSSICNMSSLTLLDLSRNNFSNSIPSCLGSMANLTVLDLRRNNFTGSLPPLCGQSTSLSTIVVNGNRFEGPVPVSLLNCNGLQVLDVGNNAINDMFPAWLGTLQELQVLILTSNKFHGPISTCQTKFCFPKLRIFDLSHNDFSGSLPAKVFGNFKAMIKLDGEDTGEIKYMKSLYISYEDSVSLVIKGQDIELQRISTIMTTIDLSSNHFEGVIPETLKDLSSLRLLNLSHNNLIGHIPVELGQLNKLEALDLSWNRLTGKIPQELTRMNFLAVLNISQNHLVGPIPHGLQFNTFENDSYGGNLDLCGLPLTKKCGTSDSSHVPQQLESEEEGESYFFCGFTWESVVIGYIFGLVVGTVMWSLMFKYRKPKWFVEFFDGLMPHKRRRPKKKAQRRRT